MRFTFTGFQIENYKELKSVSEMFSNRQYECDLAEAHLVLFMYDQPFLDLKKDLTVGIINLEGIVEKAMYKVYFAYSKCEFDLELYKNELSKQSEARGTLLKELEPLTAGMREERTEEFKLIHTLHSKLAELIRERLKLLDED